MYRTGKGFFKIASGRRFFSVLTRQEFAGAKSPSFNEFLLRPWRDPNTKIKIKTLPIIQKLTLFDEIRGYETLLENPNYSTSIIECKEKKAKVEKAIEKILPTEELVPLQGEEDEQGNVKSYDEQKIVKMTVPGFMYHVDHKNFENSFQKIIDSKILQSRLAANGAGAYAYSLSGMYCDHLDWFKRIFASKSHILVFVPRNLDLASFSLRKDFGEIMSKNDINLHLVLTTEPTSDGSKNITIHDYTLTAFLLAKFVENFQIGEQIIKTIFAEYNLGVPISGDLYANAQHAYKMLNRSPDIADRKFKGFKKYIDGLLSIHSDICKLIDGNPKLSQKLEELSLLTAIKETPGKIVKLDASQNIINADDQQYSPPSFTAK